MTDATDDWNAYFGALPESDNDRMHFSIGNLDVFFSKCYLYYTERGLYSIFLSRITNLLTLAFTVIFSTFLLLCVDWALLVSCTSLETVDNACHGVIGLKSSTISEPTFFEIVIITYFIIFSLYWFFNLFSFYYTMRDATEMRQFFTDKLKISDDSLGTLEWYIVVDRLVELQNVHNYSIVKRLDSLDITNRIMRKENFMIGLFNSNLITIRFNLYDYIFNNNNNNDDDDDVDDDDDDDDYKHNDHHNMIEDDNIGLEYEHIDQNTRELINNDNNQSNSKYKSYYIFGQSLEWNIRYCLLNVMFNKDFLLRRDLMDSAIGIQKLKNRFIFVGIINILILPFILIFEIVFFCLKHAEFLHSKKNRLGAREWTPYGQWKIREYNELPHLFQHRLDGSYNIANEYISQFPSTLLAIIAQCIAYVSGAIVGIIALITLNDTSLLINVSVFDQSLLWHLALFSIILAISRSFIPEGTFIFKPTEIMKEIVTYTHYLPLHWRGQTHTYNVYNEFSILFKSRISIFIDEIICVLCTPFILIFILPNRSEKIIDFLRDNTVRIDGVGDVCGPATFNIDEYGKDMYDMGINKSQKEYIPPVDLNNNDNDDNDNDNDNDINNNRIRKINRQGKMEKSLLSFVVNNRNFELKSLPTRQFVKNVLERTYGIPNNNNDNDKVQIENKNDNDNDNEYLEMPSFTEHTLNNNQNNNQNNLNMSFASLTKELQSSTFDGSDIMGLSKVSSTILNSNSVLMRSKVLNNNNNNIYNRNNNLYGDHSISNLFSMLERGYEIQLLQEIKKKKKKSTKQPMHQHKDIIIPISGIRRDDM